MIFHLIFGGGGVSDNFAKISVAIYEKNTNYGISYIGVEFQFSLVFCFVKNIC